MAFMLLYTEDMMRGEGVYEGNIGRKENAHVLINPQKKETFRRELFFGAVTFRGLAVNYCWSSPAQWLLVPIHMRLVKIL
jgi:hypothetical protein